MDHDENAGADRSAATSTKKPTLLGPPARPERFSLARLSLTYKEVKLLFETIADGASDVRIHLFWRNASVSEATELTSATDLNGLANPAEVASLVIGATYEDRSRLDLTLGFDTDPPCVEVYHGQHARIVASKIIRDYRHLRRGPVWLWHLRSNVLRPGHFTIYASALSAVVTTTAGIALFAVGHEQFAAGWKDLAIALLCFGLFVALCYPADRHMWFQLQPNDDRVAPNWEVRWAAIGAIVGIVSLVIGVSSLIVALRASHG